MLDARTQAKDDERSDTPARMAPGAQATTSRSCELAIGRSSSAVAVATRQKQQRLENLAGFCPAQWLADPRLPGGQKAGASR
jgi:hypothetical protein